jgi:hypothetical protein
MLTREQLRARKPLRTASVVLPERGGEVTVCRLSGAGRDFVMSGNDDPESDAWRVGFRDRIVVSTLLDENGDRVFADDEVAFIREMDAADVSAIFTAACVLNGFGGAAVDASEKNSEAATSGASTSASPATSDAPSENSSSESTATS